MKTLTFLCMITMFWSCAELVQRDEKSSGASEDSVANLPVEFSSEQVATLGQYLPIDLGNVTPEQGLALILKAATSDPKVLAELKAAIGSSK